MNQVKVISTLQSDEVRRALRGLAPKVQERILKKGMRRGMQPMRDALRQAWRAANYRGKDTHRKAIASATLIDARRTGRGTEIQGRVGVMYGRKGGAAAKGRQKIWHLLEKGFSRFDNRSAYTNYSAAARSDRDGYRKFVKDNRAAIMSEGLPKQMRSDALRAMYADARTKFSIFTGERASRKTERAKSGRARMPGAFISYKVMVRKWRETMMRVREEIIDAAREALREGGRRGNR